MVRSWNTSYHKWDTKPYWYLLPRIIFFLLLFWCLCRLWIMVSLHNYSTRLSVYKENSMSCRIWKNDWRNIAFTLTKKWVKWPRWKLKQSIILQIGGTIWSWHVDQMRYSKVAYWTSKFHVSITSLWLIGMQEWLTWSGYSKFCHINEIIFSASEMEFFYLGFMKINWSLLLNREVTLKYNQAVYQLKKELLDALSESLGLPTSFLMMYLEKVRTQTWYTTHHVLSHQMHSELSHILIPTP